ncbi:MAG: TolC family protein [Betaproteobacteria bacterium]|nr:TolC family protein [Betaproteobacteria bacterium]
MVKVSLRSVVPPTITASSKPWNSMIVVRWPIVILMAGMAAAHAAPDGAAIRLSLPEAERRWQEHDREVRQAALAVRGAEADLVAAGQPPNPQLSLNVLSISPNEGFGAGNLREKKMDSILRLEQLIERGDKRELRSQSAEANLDATRRDLDETRRQQRLALHNAYFDLMLAQEKKRFSEDTVSLYANSLRAGDARLNAGDISRSDHSRLRVEKLRAENDARQSIADYGQAQVALAYLVGLESRADALVTEDGWPALEAQPAPASAMGQIAGRPDIRAARARVVAAEAARDLARALKKRDVTLGVQLEHNLQNAPRSSFGFGVSVPLFVRYEYEGEIARAEADLHLAREQMEKLVALALGERDQARHRLAASTERRQRLENELLADAERVAKAAEFAFNKGAISLLDLLDARRTWRQVQLDAVQARADYAKATSAWRMLTAWEKP